VEHCYDPMESCLVDCRRVGRADGPVDIFFRGYNSDEGLAVSIARTAIDDGKWLVPQVFNLRWIERPTLLSCIIAAISAPFGNVSQITARLPIALFLLFGCVLIYLLLRKLAASVPAALLGVTLFLACPLVIRSSVLITWELPVAVLLFFAFYLWWGGNEKGSISIGRWLAIGIVLQLAGLLKGPQTMHPGPSFSGPLGPILRILGDTLPAALAAVVYLVARRLCGSSLAGRGLVRPGFVPAVACYALAAGVFVLLWPGGTTSRYYFPMVPPLCVFGGLSYDLLSTQRPQIVASLMLLTGAFLAYALVYSFASPFLPMR
jgi:hypothetical protein